MGDYVVKVEEGRSASDGKPSAGPVYRCIYAKDGLLDIPTELDSPWNFFSESVKKNPNNQMLGRRQFKDGKGDKCGIYGANCPEWIIAMEACIGQSITYVPLYDTLGANAVEFIINHAEVSIAFVQESKLLSGDLDAKGLTESCSGCFTSIANVFPMMGTVGVPMTTIEARLESVPEMGYDALSSVPRGEICLRGSTLFSGYHKRPDLTAEVVVDGWFHTGDVGEWQPNGAMKIIDRKKNIFKLSQGEYVAVESIESVYSRCPLITSIWVYGNSFESFLVAVVVPEKKALEEWAANNQEKGDFQSLCSNTKARKYILDELNSTAKTHNLRGFEMLRGVHLEPVPFGIDRDLVTPTFKLKRPQLLKYFKVKSRFLLLSCFLPLHEYLSGHYLSWLTLYIVNTLMLQHIQDCIDHLYSEAKGTKA
ncbi:UNVERIFIED_CONTAM: Long chain acyl-CoA synthetase 2 [Sesamum radiatum]|uniref:Long chain acyl-CoA synthetase 2 n=1 Tax=Sesamum radiatum TaxID=300843 RepID=A0AAW2RXL5_SESRA